MSKDLDATAKVLMKLSLNLFAIVQNYNQPSLEMLHDIIYTKAQCKFIYEKKKEQPQIRFQALSCALHLDSNKFPQSCEISLHTAQQIENIIDNTAHCNAFKFQRKLPMKSLHEHVVIVAPSKDFIVRKENLQFLKCSNNRSKQRHENILQYARHLSFDSKQILTETPKVMIKSLNINDENKWDEVYSITNHFFITFRTVCIQICLVDDDILYIIQFQFC